MLKVEVKKRYSFFELDVKFEVKPNIYTILLGPSGAGKSLTLKIIAGFEKPDQGDIAFNGINLTQLPPENREIVYLPQGLGLFPHMTVRQNLEFSFKCKGKKTEKSLLNKIINEFGLKNLLEKKPRELSGGEKQRVALARAILATPKVLLLDEPLSSLDFDLKVRLIKFLKEIHKKFDLTVLHVTHDPFEAVSLGEEILLIENGKITSPENSQTLKDFFNLMNNLKNFHLLL